MEAKTNANYNYQTQGVTTAVTGNCGFGPADVADYFAKLEKIGVGTNVIHQVPHNAVREKVMGNANREPTEKELKLMEEVVDKGMKDGAWGLATGLIYTPGTYAKTEELVALARIAAHHKGLYASHIRDEGTGVLTAIDEILTIARRAELRAYLAHQGLRPAGLGQGGRGHRPHSPGAQGRHRSPRRRSTISYRCRSGTSPTRDADPGQVSRRKGRRHGQAIG